MKTELYKLFKDVYGSRMEKYINQDLSNNFKYLPSSEEYHSKECYDSTKKWTVDGTLKNKKYKCTACIASVFRQDLPFWQGSIQKKIMLVGQDAGKGTEMASAETKLFSVFGFHDLVRNTNKSTKTENYCKYLAKLFGSDWQNQLYVTDIVKCAYSTAFEKPELNDYRIKDKDIHGLFCVSNCFAEEVRTVNPTVIVAMGSAAATGITKALKNIKLVDEKKVKINERKDGRANNVYLKEYLHTLDGITRHVFTIPHLGNLHLTEEGKSNLDEAIGSIGKLIRQPIHKQREGAYET
ncbi:MAG: hypothetical protein JNL74_20045 [Fibrobacteres bacterium]|nr:hypothetical protein [Fibrobacterota bacterium]